MNPVLYPENELTRIIPIGPGIKYKSNGIGVLADCISCLVTEERNGEYELSMQYPSNGLWAEDIEVGQVIKAKANDTDDPQLFEIYDVTRNLGGAYEIKAAHVSYRLSGIPVRAYSASGAAAAFAGLETNALPVYPRSGPESNNTGFSWYTDMESTTAYSIEKPRSARSIIGGAEGSLLDVYGGEYHFDNFKVSWLKNRGADNGVSIRYGKNLTNLEQDIRGMVYTGIYPYWYKENEGLVAADNIVYAQVSADKLQRIEIVDLTDDFDEKPSKADLETRAQQLVTGMGSPVETLEVSFITLHQLREYETIAALEKVGLCDLVHVVYPILGVDVKMKVVKTVYNTLTEHYESITCGTLQTTLADIIENAALSGGSGRTESVEEDEYKLRTVTQLSSTSLASGGGKDVGFTAPDFEWMDGGIKYKLVSNCPLQINTRGTGSTYVITSQMRPGGCYLRNTGSGSATVEVLTYYLYQKKHDQT